MACRARSRRGGRPPLHGSPAALRRRHKATAPGQGGLTVYYLSGHAEKIESTAMTKQAEGISSGPVLTSAEPQLFVGDIGASCAFFTGKLGFAVDFLYGDPPFYAQVRRDAALLNLRHVDHPVFDQALRECEDLLSAAITVDDVELLYSEFQPAGVCFHQALRREPWGAQTFIIKDPDGNLVLFGGPAD
jgi:catechol 2,3-dioxygenase-like lactoylglutathione lyase family enzyme